MNQNTNKKRVLLIDDDPITNYLHSVIIEKSGFSEQISKAENGVEALSLLRGNEQHPPIRPELILLDINMPIMDGWEFLEEYRNDQVINKSRITLVILTTSMNPEHKDKAQSMNEVDFFLQKPLTIEALNKIYSS